MDMVVISQEVTCWSQRIALPRNLFLLTHLFAPVFLMGLLFVGLQGSGLDVWISAHFYDPNSHQWPYKEYWFIEQVMHKGGQNFFIILIICIFCLLLASFKTDSTLKIYKRSLAYLFLASITGPLIIIFLKHHTHFYCPWDLQIFDSVKPLIRWFDPVSPLMPVGNCFPAAHAGSGFTFVNLYFFFLAVRPKIKFAGLYFGLILGGLYGITQQMRGAHFLSHDVAALAVCWFTAFILFIVCFRNQLQWN